MSETVDGLPAKERFSPDSFFEVLLPAILVEKQVALATLDGVLQFYLMGPRDRAYYADFTSRPPMVFTGEAEVNDLVVAVDESLVLPLIAGELDVEAALADESLQVEGEYELLAGFAEALKGSMSGMDMLYASAKARR